MIHAPEKPAMAWVCVSMACANVIQGLAGQIVKMMIWRIALAAADHGCMADAVLPETVARLAVHLFGQPVIVSFKTTSWFF